ncbi:hypothetical protein [Nocardia altamirensis]|uniref:hypothetical protein n=1 Tax=Nocardia altamirensis TaxID=472158 RepID=UPI00083FE00A|nr:hypothetical protein [Nocardia altamirensis]
MSAWADDGDYAGFLQHEDGSWSVVGEDGFTMPLGSADVDALLASGLVALCDIQVIDVKPLSVRDLDPYPPTELERGRDDKEIEP